MKILDCTLRDGANVVGNGFSAGLTVSMIENLIACGIPDIEFGNAKGIGSYEQGAAAPLDDEAYMKLAAPYAEKGRLGMFLLAKNADEDKVKMARDNGLSFIRVGIAAGDGERAVHAVEMVKRAGLFCRYSLMKAYICTPDELAKEAKMLENAGIDAITIMDSAGYMYPTDAAEYVKALKDTVSVPVGFHGHSNLGLSQANALAAAETGADEIDGGLLGMARSAGNCATELAAATLMRKGLMTGVDLFKLLAYLDHTLIPAMKEYHYHTAVCPEDLVLGLTGCHSQFLKLFHQVAEEEHVDVYRLIAGVSEIDKKLPTQELMHQVASALRQ